MLLFPTIPRQIVNADALGTDFGLQCLLSSTGLAAQLRQFLSQFGQGLQSRLALLRVTAASLAFNWS